MPDDQHVILIHNQWLLPPKPFQRRGSNLHRAVRNTARILLKGFDLAYRRFDYRCKIGHVHTASQRQVFRIKRARTRRTRRCAHCPLQIDALRPRFASVVRYRTPGPGRRRRARAPHRSGYHRHPRPPGRPTPRRRRISAEDATSAHMQRQLSHSRWTALKAWRAAWRGSTPASARCSRNPTRFDGRLSSRIRLRC
jgi:hypothetical protein